MVHNPENEKNFKIQPLGNGFVVRSDSERFGENEIVFQGINYKECLKYVGEREEPIEPSYYVIKDISSWRSDIREIYHLERSDIERFPSVEEAIAVFNRYKEMDYLKQNVTEPGTEQPMRRLVLGMSYEPHQPRELDLLHTEGAKTLLISDIVGERENGYERFMTNEKVIRDLNAITKAIAIDEYSYYRDLTLAELAERKFQYMQKEYPEMDFTYEEAEDFAKRHVAKHPNYLKNNKVNERVPFTEFNAPYLYDDDSPALGEEKAQERYRIVTEEGKEIMSSRTYQGCERYWDACNGIYEDEDGEHRIFIEDRNSPKPSEEVTLHIRYKEPRNINGAMIENDTITFCGLDDLKRYLRGEVTYDSLDNTVIRKENEVPVHVCDAQGEVVWQADNARVVGHKGR